MHSILPSGKSTLVKLGISLDLLKTVVLPWRRSHYRAIINWLTKYEPQPDASNLDKVLGYLESFYLLCEVEAEEAAQTLLGISLNTPTGEEVYSQLSTWSYYQELIAISNKLLKIARKAGDRQRECGVLGGLGNTYSNLGDQVQAIEYSNQS